MTLETKARTVCVLLIVLLVATACETGGGTTSDTDGGYVPDPPTVEPAADPDVSGAALDFGEAQLDLLLAGATAPPSSISWASITEGLQLPGDQKTVFCEALGVQGADNALSSILAAGLNALSMRFRKRPVADDTKEILGLAVTFATNTCPAWDPTRPPIATPRPITPWYSEGYQPLILQPDVAWRWADANTDIFKCDEDEGTRCYGLKVDTRYGCGRLEGTIATYDANGVVLEFLTDTKLDLQVLNTTLVFGFYDEATADAMVMSISCA
jgi:hypothetical protein